MTADNTPSDAAPQSGGPLKPAGRWLRVALAVSLAANLAVAGIVAGAMLRERGGMQNRMMSGDLGFGPFTDALSKDDRASLRNAFLAAAPEMRDVRKAMRADFDDLFAKLRQVPLDAEGLRAAFDRQNRRNSDRLQLGQKLIFDLVVGMKDETRLKFADRLEETLAKGPKHREKATAP